MLKPFVQFILVIFLTALIGEQVKQSKSIFDVSNINDLPDQIKKDLDQLRKKPKKFSIRRNLIELLNIAERSLSLEEIVVGYYRHYNQSPRAHSIYAAICKLVKNTSLNMTIIGDVRYYSLSSKTLNRS